MYEEKKTRTNKLYFVRAFYCPDVERRRRTAARQDNKNEELLYGPGTEINPSPFNDVPDTDTDTDTQTSLDEDPCLQVDHDLVQNAKIKIKISPVWALYG